MSLTDSDGELLLWLQVAARRAALGSGEDLQLLLADVEDLSGVIHRMVQNDLLQLGNDLGTGQLAYHLIDAQDWEIILQMAPDCLDVESRELLETWIDELVELELPSQAHEFLESFYHQFPIPVSYRLLSQDAA